MSKYLDQLTAKTTLVADDEFLVGDSQNSNINKKIKASDMQTYFGSGGSGSSEIITNDSVYTGSNITLNDWTNIQAITLQAGKYLVLGRVSCYRGTTTAQTWQMGIYNDASSTYIASSSDNTASSSSQWCELSCWAIITLTAENTTIRTRAKATTTTSSVVSANSVNSIGGATRLTALKLDGISGGGGSSYTLPIATESVLGGIKTNKVKEGIQVNATTGNIGFLDGTYGNLVITHDGNDTLHFDFIDNTIMERKLVMADNTTNNTSTSKHGFFPKLPNTTKLYNGKGEWVTGLDNIANLSGVDLDSYKEPGVFFVNSNCTNKPIATGTYSLFVVNNGTTDVVTQICFTNNIYIPKMYLRTNAGAGWSLWVELGAGGGGLPTDNWILGNNNELYNVNSLLNIINGNSNEFAGNIVRCQICGDSNTDNGHSAYIYNTQIFGSSNNFDWSIIYDSLIGGSSNNVNCAVDGAIISSAGFTYSGEINHSIVFGTGGNTTLDYISLSDIFSEISQLSSLTLSQIHNSTIHTIDSQIVNTRYSSVYGKEHTIDEDLVNGGFLEGSSVLGKNVDKPRHINSEYINSGNDIANGNKQLNMKFVGDAHFIVGDEGANFLVPVDFHFRDTGITANRHTDVIYFDPSYQFLSFDTHITYVFRNNKIPSNILYSGTFKSLGMLDTYNTNYGSATMRSEVPIHMQRLTTFLNATSNDIRIEKVDDDKAKISFRFIPRELMIAFGNSIQGYNLDMVITIECQAITFAGGNLPNY